MYIHAAFVTKGLAFALSPFFWNLLKTTSIVNLAVIVLNSWVNTMHVRSLYWEMCLGRCYTVHKRLRKLRKNDFKQLSTFLVFTHASSVVTSTLFSAAATDSRGRTRVQARRGCHSGRHSDARGGGVARRQHGRHVLVRALRRRGWPPVEWLHQTGATMATERACTQGVPHTTQVSQTSLIIPEIFDVVTSRVYA